MLGLPSMSNSTLRLLLILAIGATIFAIYHFSEGIGLGLAPDKLRIGIWDMGEDTIRLENRMSLGGHNSKVRLEHRVRKKVS